ncbi:MAG: hypothetical protein NVS3B2_07960 [Ramlibacter sp.]
MSGSDSSARNPDAEHGADGTTGSGKTGEGARSALEEMLRKRQMGVHQAPEPARPPRSQPHDGTAAEE